MSKLKQLIIFFIFLIISISLSVSGSEMVFNFSKGSSTGSQFVQNLSTIQDFIFNPKLSELTTSYSSFNDKKISNFGVWIYPNGTFIRGGFMNEKAGFSNNSYYLFNLGFNSTFLTIADNKTFYIFQREGSTDFGSNAFFLQLDFFLNDTFYISKDSKIQLTIPYMDYVICNNIGFGLLLNEETQIKELKSTGGVDRYNYTLNFTTDKGYFFNRFFIFTQACSISENYRVYFSDVKMENTTLAINTLPEFNFSVSGDFCINTTKKGDKTTVYLNISAYDLENDTILYSLEKQTENLKEVVTYSDDTVINNYCGLYVPLLDIFIFENWDIFCLHKDNEVSISLNPKLYNENLNNRCLVDFNSKNNSKIYVDRFTGISENDNYMLVIPSLCIGDKKEAVYKIETGLRDFQYETQFYYQKPINISLTFYNSMNPELIISNLTIIANSSFLNVRNNNQNVIYLSGLSLFSNFSYDYNFLTVNVLFDYESNKFNISIGDKTGKNYTGNYSGNLNPNSTKYLKYVGFGIKNSLEDEYLYQEIFTLSAYYDKLGFSSVQPNNITYTELKNDYLTLFVTDSFHLGFDTYYSKSQVINIKSCEYKTEDININFDINNFCPKYSIESINNIICALRTPAIIGYQLNTLHFFNDILILFLIYLIGSLYMKFAGDVTNTLETPEIIRRVFIITFLVVFGLYYFFMLGDKNIFVGFSAIGILMLGFSLNKVLHLESSSIEESLLYSTLWFNLFAFIFFSFVQTPVYSNFGIIDFPNIVLKLDVFSLIDNLKLVGNYLINVFFFSIPDLNSFLKLFFGLLRVISIMSFIFVISKKFGDTIQYLLNFFKGFF